MVHRYGKLVVALTLAVLLGSTALAQLPFAGGFGGASMLLMNPDVQKELNLTEEQVTKAKDVSKQVREKFKEDFTKLKDASKEERQEKMQELFKTIGTETEKSLKDVLKPEQQKRLKQLELQQRGVDALTDAEVEKALNLTAEQKEKIKTLRDDAGKDMREIFKGAQGNFQEAQTKVQSLRKETLEKATATLNETQKKAWKDLTGAPFEFKFQPRRLNQ